ncbi:hypothetical protein KKB11_02865, partial [Candidatus Micrarchaeota archaeon]|nr:hypothetical protein [Candidatus Micrarchaeota archaeon]
FVFFGSQKEIFFVDGVKEVDGFWLDAGFSRDVLSDLSQSQASLEKLDALEDKLVLFRDSLKGYKQTEDVKALSAFVEVQLYAVEELRLALKVSFVKAGLEAASGDDVCLFSDELNELGENTILLNEQMKLMNESVYVFSDDFPGFVNDSGLDRFLVNELDFDETISENKEILLQLKEACP